jgi:hypothetical protein
VASTRQTSDGEPSIRDYLRWLTVEVACLPEVFAGVNENFVSAVIEGMLMMARDSVDLAALQASAADSGADVLLGERDVQKTVRIIMRSWWRSCGYKSTFAAVQTKLRKVNDRLHCF